MNPHHIGRAEFMRYYGITSIAHYSEFCDHVTRRLLGIIDLETKVCKLRIESSWKDAGGNRHATVRGEAERHDDRGEIGAEIVWLIRSKSFRGSFWSRLPQRSDSDYYALARLAFYRRDYSEFLRLAAFIMTAYDDHRIFKKMVKFANRRINNVSEQGAASDR